MKIICAGLYKTGTKSLASALQHLGYTVHDIHEQWEFYLDEWNQAYEGTIPDLAAMYADIDAVTDLPSCFFFEDIFKAFPNAKVVLSVRDTKEAWAKSLVESLEIWDKTYNQLWLILARCVTPTGRKWKKLIDMQALTIAEQDYDEHNARVKAVIPSDQLLVFNTKQGWEPLCEFLGQEVPGIPFPRRNIKSSYIPDLINKASIVDKMWKELVVISSLIVLVVAVCIFLLGRNGFARE